MKYIQMPELVTDKCSGCAHDKNIASYTDACVTQRNGVAAWEACEGSIWIADTDEARIAYLTTKLTT